MQVNTKKTDTIALLRHALHVVAAGDVGELSLSQQKAVWRSLMLVAGEHQVATKATPFAAENSLFGVTATAWHVTVLSSAQRTAGKLFDALADGESVNLAATGVEVELVFDKKGRSSVSYSGELVNTFPFAVGLLLTKPEAERRVRRCPHCRKLFIRVRRQIYCSDSCTDKATWAKYPAARKRAARVRQYEKNGWTFGKRKGAKKR